MAASPPRTRAGRRPRARRGSLERPVSGRIYRATWALVALPLLVAAFTVGRPAALPPPDLPPSFDQATASRVAQELVQRYPDRTPGTADARDAASWVADRLDDYELAVERRPFVADVPGRGRVELLNLIARPPAADGEESIVVLAHRDNLGLSAGLDDNASGTAGLIELARTLSTISLQHPVIFVSADGGAYGNLGAAQLAADDAFRGGVLAVVNLDSLAGSAPPRLELAGDRPRSPAGELLATADASVLAETDRAATYPNVGYQLLDLAFPFSFFGQSPFIAEGVSALTLTSAGDRAPKPAEDAAAGFSPESAQSLGALGAAAQRLLGSLDGAAEIAQGTDSYIYLGGRLVRGFAVAFLLVVAILPPLVTTVDLLARIHRRGGTLAPAVRAYVTRLVVWLFAGGVAALFSWVGLFPHGAPRPLSPDEGPGVEWPVWALIGFAALSGLAWLAIRPRLLPTAQAPRAEELAGHVVAMLALCIVALALAIVNPFSLLLVLPSLHAWLWIPHVRDLHPAIRAAVYGIGFVGPILVVISFALRFGLGLDAPWYVAALFSVGYAPTSLFLAFLAWGAAAGQLGAILSGRYAPVQRRARDLGELEEGDLGAGRELAVATLHDHERVGLRGGHDHV